MNDISSYLGIAVTMFSLVAGGFTAGVYLTKSDAESKVALAEESRQACLEDRNEFKSLLMGDVRSYPFLKDKLDKLEVDYENLMNDMLNGMRNVNDNICLDYIRKYECKNAPLPKIIPPETTRDRVKEALANLDNDFLEARHQAKSERQFISMSQASTLCLQVGETYKADSFNTQQINPSALNFKILEVNRDTIVINFENQNKNRIVIKRGRSHQQDIEIKDFVFRYKIFLKKINYLNGTACIDHEIHSEKL